MIMLDNQHIILCLEVIRMQPHTDICSLRVVVVGRGGGGRGLTVYGITCTVGDVIWLLICRKL